MVKQYINGKLIESDKNSAFEQLAPEYPGIENRPVGLGHLWGMWEDGEQEDE